MQGGGGPLGRKDFWGGQLHGRHGVFVGVDRHVVATTLPLGGGQRALVVGVENDGSALVAERKGLGRGSCGVQACIVAAKRYVAPPWADAIEGRRGGGGPPPA